MWRSARRSARRAGQAAVRGAGAWSAAVSRRLSSDRRERTRPREQQPKEVDSKFHSRMPQRSPPPNTRAAAANDLLPICLVVSVVFRLINERPINASACKSLSKFNTRSTGVDFKAATSPRGVGRDFASEQQRNVRANGVATAEQASSGDSSSSSSNNSHNSRRRRRRRRRSRSRRRSNGALEQACSKPGSRHSRETTREGSKNSGDADYTATG